METVLWSLRVVSQENSEVIDTGKICVPKGTPIEMAANAAALLCHFSPNVDSWSESETEGVGVMAIGKYPGAFNTTRWIEFEVNYEST